MKSVGLRLVVAILPRFQHNQLPKQPLAKT